MCNPERYVNVMLLDYRHKFVYFPIPKVACVSLHMWMLEINGIQHKNGRDALDRGHKCFFIKEAYIPKDFLMFAFVRNPYTRLVSGFVDKFISADKDGPSKKCIEFLEKEGKSITFRNFVYYLSKMDLLKVNEHWVPQHFFLLQKTKMGVLGKLETFDKDFQHIIDFTRLTIRPGKINTINYNMEDSNDILVDVPIDELRKENLNPSGKHLYTEELKELVYNLYKEDFEKLGYPYE